MSAHQLHRMLGITYKSAWFMFHRIREAMRPSDTPTMGGNGGRVEVDETYIGRKKGVDVGKGGFRHKMRVVSLVDRDTGIARSIPANAMKAGEVSAIVRNNVAREAKFTTDERSEERRAGTECVSTGRSRWLTYH